ncbi:hypothetical protein OGAPHI_006930 [Ogataea philodendri]|uniref:Peptidase C9 domain-containing protein n=1 Tax=Ogataea philodendri TaxID=1378263 RepID=A0A9P8NWI2_9ASCO|nr:uncharacterized protein OGAPHI_006930 [Ogataea philodendri]KAH3660344.1 hypothetical protein OGAPHI_006930 [Ogataea philodendri]
MGVCGKTINKLLTSASAMLVPADGINKRRDVSQNQTKLRNARVEDQLLYQVISEWIHHQLCRMEINSIKDQGVVSGEILIDLLLQEPTTVLVFGQRQHVRGFIQYGVVSDVGLSGSCLDRLGRSNCQVLQLFLQNLHVCWGRTL